MELKCGQCGSGDVYTTQNSIRVCRRCGSRKEIKNKREDINEKKKD